MPLKWQTQYETTINWSTYDAGDLNTMINKLESIEAHTTAATNTERPTMNNKTKMSTTSSGTAREKSIEKKYGN